jgi:hypothetical protein
VEIRRIIQRKIDRREQGLDLQANVNTVVAANVGEGTRSAYLTSMQSVFSRSGGAGPNGEATPRRDTRERPGEHPTRET